MVVVVVVVVVVMVVVVVVVAVAGVDEVVVAAVMQPLMKLFIHSGRKKKVKLRRIFFSLSNREGSYEDVLCRSRIEKKSTQAFAPSLPYNQRYSIFCAHSWYTLEAIASELRDVNHTRKHPFKALPSLLRHIYFAPFFSTTALHPTLLPRKAPPHLLSWSALASPY